MFTPILYIVISNGKVFPFLKNMINTFASGLAVILFPQEHCGRERDELTASKREAQVCKI